MGLKVTEQLEPSVKILLIDDDVLQHKLVSSALKNKFTVTCEGAGADAVAVATHLKPDLILLDLQMPNVDGFEVLLRLKHNPTTAGIPIFCLSGSTDETTRNRCYQSGAAGFFTKPIDVRSLSKDLEQTIKNLNDVIVSADKRNSVYLGLNDQHLATRFQELVKRSAKIISLSIKEGVYYNDSMVDQLVKNEDIIYLQIKPSLITRLPFMDDLEMVMNDLKKLLDTEATHSVVVIDRPELFLLTPGNENKTATILAFSDAMNRHFPEVHYLCKKPSTPFELPLMMEMSKLLVREI